MQGGGVAQLAQGLFNNSFGLQVTPRRRLFKNSGPVAVPANSTANINLVTPFSNDLIGKGDGLQFDTVLVLASAAAPGLTISALSATIDFGQGGGVIVSGTTLPNQPIFTVSNISATANFTGLLTPNPALLTFDDLEALSVGGITDQTGRVQVRGDITAIVANSTAGAINVQILTWWWVRFVNGLQEG